MITKRFLLLTATAIFVSCVAPSMAQEQTPAVDAPQVVETPADAVPAAPEAVAVPEEAPPVTPAAEVPPADVPAPETVDANAAPAPASQEPVVALPDLSEDVPVQKDLLNQLRLRKPPIDIEKMPSLFLTVWERDLVINARKGLLTRDPDSPDEVVTEAPPPTDAPVNVYESPRDIRLSGIIFRDAKDWTIWLNAKRISPNALPKEIMDLKVTKDYIDLQWFDAQTNQIFPIRLRPHQRFNLDARVFLPG